MEHFVQDLLYLDFEANRKKFTSIVFSLLRHIREFSPFLLGLRLPKVSLTGTKLYTTNAKCKDFYLRPVYEIIEIYICLLPTTTALRDLYSFETSWPVIIS